MTELEKAAKLHIWNHPNNGMSYPEWDGADAYDAFVAGAEWQAKQSPWISVEDRLPDHNDNLYITLDTKMNPPGCGVCDFDVKNKRWIDNRFEVVYPTHWMPIPE